MHTVEVPKMDLFTITQIPVLYKLSEATEPNLEILSDGTIEKLDGDVLNELFAVFII